MMIGLEQTGERIVNNMVESKRKEATKMIDPFEQFVLSDMLPDP